MHKSQQYLSSTLYCGAPVAHIVTGRAISASEARTLQSSLNEDAVDYLYSATVSLGDALGGVTRKLFTWSTVKLYYSTFYAVRARLALRGVCLFYLGTHPFSLRAQTGDSARKEKGQTHKIVLDLFRRHNSDPFLLSQPIGTDDPLQWLMNLREEVNYKTARFTEPDVPTHFLKLFQAGVRRACQAYLADDTGLYVFDPDHAILAYPLRLLVRCHEEFEKQGLCVQKKEDLAFLQRLLSDEKGPLSHLIKVCARA